MFTCRGRLPRRPKDRQLAINFIVGGEIMDHPFRKNIRLNEYDYSQNGAYFVTICTENRRNLLSTIVGGDFHVAPAPALTAIGIEVEKTIQWLNERNNSALFDKYVVMPNHFHCIIMLETGGRGSPPLHEIIKQFKTYTTKRYNEMNGTISAKLWQRNYYEHIIRNETDYRDIWQYINENPVKWADDEYY
jgi:REP element-mobilizing transposase RayT